MNDYVTMKDIGQELQLSSHQVGRKLKDLGLRTNAGRPSRFAFDGGFVKQKWSGDNCLWAWHSALTMKTLATIGLKPKADTPNCPK